MKLNITCIQLFTSEYSHQISATENEILEGYAADIVINNSFIVQCSGNKDEATFDGIPSSKEVFWLSEIAQDEASQLDHDLEPALKKLGFENNYKWLSNHVGGLNN
ncbi:MAG: hypothetical protein Q9M28_02705 [Mariprofundaceae bacterium]|nr:hypothetical protein [Mariprofundaceae bacterium]